MAFQTGTATSPTDLLDKLRIWLVAGGWTQNHDAADGTGRRVQVSKSGMFVNFRSFSNESSKYFGNVSQTPTTHAGIAFHCGTGYSGATSWENQAGVPTQAVGAERLTMICALNVGAISAYFFFADATFDNICVVVQRASGVYAHLFFGTSVTKVNTYTGGMYFGASRYGNTSSSAFTSDANDGGATASAACPGGIGPNQTCCGFFRADVDTFLNKWCAFTISTSTTLTTGKRCLTPAGGLSADDAKTSGMIDYGQSYNGSVQPPVDTQQGLAGTARSVLNGGAVLLPLSVWVERDAGLGGWAFAGFISNIFNCNSAGHAFGSDYNISTDTYVMFPAFAVKKIP